MDDHVDGVGAGDLRDERQEAVPERERVPGMEAAVGELVRGVEREVVEGEELLDAGEVEEPVAADVAGDAPEQEAEEHAGSQHRPSPRDGRRLGPAPEPGREGDDARPEQQREREA